MHAFLREFITEWRRLDLPAEGETIVAAVSGGADSLSLILALHELTCMGKLGNRIIAAHFNHRLRGDASDADEDFVRAFAAERKIELAVGRSDASPKASLEQNARIERYGFLGRTAENLHAAIVLTGHTINDQAETLLMNLIRGSGIRGLGGMRVVRPLIASQPRTPMLVRPLLRWAHRSDTEGFCRSLGIEYRYDTMNEDETFRRVRIRKVLLPLLEDLNPKIVDRLAETAELLQNELPETPETGIADLRLTDLRTLSKADLYRTLRGWIDANRGDLKQIDLKHIEAIERLLNSQKSGRVAELPGGYVVRKQGGRLRIEQIMVEKGLPEN